MSQTLTLQLSDEAFATILRRAETAGLSPVGLVVASLERQFGVSEALAPVTPATEQAKPAARERFERHFGAVDLGPATGADNESIDADLAREYGGSRGL